MKRYYSDVTPVDPTEQPFTFPFSEAGGLDPQVHRPSPPSQQGRSRGARFWIKDGVQYRNNSERGCWYSYSLCISPFN